METCAGTVLGIDVGYSKNKATTGLCVLSWGASITAVFARCVSEPREREAAIARIVAGRHLLAVAIDGPLVHGLRQIKHYRAAEALLSRGVLQRRGKPGQTSSPTGLQLHRHATEIAASVIKERSISPSSHFEPIHELRVVEAFPNMFLAALVPEVHLPRLRRDASDRYWDVVVNKTARLEETLAALLPGRTLETNLRDCTDHEHRAALICAMTALAVTTGQHVGVGDPIDGDIMLPPRHLWGTSAYSSDAWMAQALLTNISKVRAVGQNHANHLRARVHENALSWSAEITGTTQTT